MGRRQLAQQAFNRARSIDPSLALPWAGMSADADARYMEPSWLIYDISSYAQKNFARLNLSLSFFQESQTR